MKWLIEGVIVCPSCEGEGGKFRLHRFEGSEDVPIVDYTFETCSMCEGKKMISVPEDIKYNYLHKFII